MSEAKTMSIHRGLTELKLLDDRIRKATNAVCLTLAKRKADKEINGSTVDEIKSEMQASHDKVISLINYRNAIKSAIVQSNATTNIEVAGEKMTVAQAIERKESIQYEKSLLSEIRNQTNRQLTIYNRKKEEFPTSLETYLVNILGSREKASKEDVELHTKTFSERNEYELLDPLDYKKVIEELEKRIEDFDSEVDAVLSESNAITQITVEV